MRKLQKKKAWVIQWDWHGEHRKVEPNILHVLPARWSAARVLDYLRVLYMNSELFLVSERFRFMQPQQEWQSYIINEGPRLSFGNNPFLMAWMVTDLTMELDEENGAEIVRWTCPPGLRYNPDTCEFENLGDPYTREFRISSEA